MTTHFGTVVVAINDCYTAIKSLKTLKMAQNNNIKMLLTEGQLKDFTDIFIFFLGEMLDNVQAANKNNCLL